MRVGVMILPEKRWSESVARWRAVESLDFDSAWTYDHLWWRSLRDQAWFSAVPLLSAVAATTGRIRIGTLVTSPNFRHPVVTAKDAMTIDDISGGRFTLGIGAGSTGAGDATVIGGPSLSAADRTARFAEFVKLVDELLREPVTTYEGRFFSAVQARMIPGCVQSPRLPIAVAATGPRGFDLVARHADAWVSSGPADFSRSYTPEEFHAAVLAQLDGLHRACDRAGRDPASVERILVTTDMTGEVLRSTDHFVAVAERYARCGITHLVVHWPRESGVFAGRVDVLEDISRDALPHVRRL